jgi:hypothetical protein
VVANSSAFATPLIAHKSRKSALTGEKMGKLVAPPFALEADGRKPAAGIGDKIPKHKQLRSYDLLN